MRILYRLVLKIDYEWKDFGIKLMKCTLKSGVQVSIQSEKREEVNVLLGQETIYLSCTSQ